MTGNLVPAEPGEQNPPSTTVPAEGRHGREVAAARLWAGIVEVAFPPVFAAIALFGGIRPIPGFEVLGDFVEGIFLLATAAWVLLAWLMFGRPARQSVLAVVSCLTLGIFAASVVFAGWAATNTN